MCLRWDLWPPGVYSRRCDQPVFWAKGTAERASQSLEFTLGVPVLERFKDVRLGVVVRREGSRARCEQLVYITVF